MEFFDNIQPHSESLIRSVRVTAQSDTGTWDVTASGDTYQQTPALENPGVGNDVTAMPVNRGLVVLGVGGYSAPVEE